MKTGVFILLTMMWTAVCSAAYQPLKSEYGLEPRPLSVDYSQVLSRRLGADNVGDLPPVTTAKLEAFINSLKALVTEQTFKYVDFQTGREEFARVLDELDRAVQNTRPQFRELLIQLGYARDLFELMLSITVDMVEAASIDDENHLLFFEVSQLRIRALAMFNSQGAPDTRIPGYMDRVNRMLERELTLEGEFRRLDIQLLPLRLRTWNNMIHAYRLLYVLKFGTQLV